MTRLPRARRLRALISVLLALLVVAGFTLATGSAEAKIKSASVFVADRNPTYGDVNSLAPGAVLLFDEPLLDPASGAQIGTSKTRVQVVSQVGDDLSFILDCTFEEPDGNIVFTGAEYFSHIASAVTFAVVGGTGRYAGVDGMVTITPATVAGQTGGVATFTFTK
jgi:hypothetical protein